MTVSKHTAAKATLLCLTLLAFGLRLYRLDYQSLWPDEIWSAIIVKGSFSSMLQHVAGDPQPPLYYILLFLWVRIAGVGDWAVRFPSVAFGLVTVPLIYAVGRKLLSNSLGVLAATIVSLSPLLVYYSQEARGFIMVVAMSLLPTFFFLVAIERLNPKAWAIWAIVAMLCINTSYFGTLIVGAQVVSYVALFMVRRRLTWRPFCLACSVAVFSLVPWFLFKRSMAGFAGIPRGTDLPTILRDTLVGFNAGLAIKPEDALLYAAAIAGVALAGALLHPRRELAALILLPSLVVPLLSLTLLLFLGGRDFAVRYALVAYPAYALLVALALDWFWRKSKLLGIPATLGIVVLSLVMLNSYYSDYQFSRDDFRAAGKYFDSLARSGDAIVFDASWGQMAFEYYSITRLPSFGIPAQLPLDEQDAESRLTDLLARYDRLWLVSFQDYFSDPDFKVGKWLNANATQMDMASFQAITIRRYRTAPVVLAEVPQLQNPLQVDFDNGMRLLGYHLDTAETASKGRLVVALYWQAMKPIGRSFRVSLKLINPAYHVFAQKDNRPVFDRIPTDVWKQGEVFRDEYTLDILPATPPGHYQLTASLYVPSDWTYAKVLDTGSSQSAFGPVAIPRSPLLPAMQQVKRTELGDSIVFLGFDLTSDWKPGSLAHLTVYWQAARPVPASYTVFTHLVDGNGKLVSQKDSQPGDGTYPTSRWTQNEIVRDQYDILIPSEVTSGTISLKVGMYDADTGVRLRLLGDPENDAVSLGGFVVQP